jgi:hypothetical protein
MGNWLGLSLRHFNVDALSYIVVTTKSDIKRIIEVYMKMTPNDDGEDALIKTPDMKVNAETFEEMLQEADIHISGIYCLKNVHLSHTIIRRQGTPDEISHHVGCEWFRCCPSYGKL